MKLIDEKGRLFGKINIVDAFIIILIMMIIPGFFYMYKILGKRPTWVPSKWVKVEAVTFTLPEIAKLIKAGQAYYAYGNPQAKILKVLKRDDKYSAKLKSEITKKAMPEYEQRIAVFLELELLCTHSAKNEPYYFARYPVIISLEKSHIFDTGTYQIRFYVLKIKD